LAAQGRRGQQIGTWSDRPTQPNGLRYTTASQSNSRIHVSGLGVRRGGLDYKHWPIYRDLFISCLRGNLRCELVLDPLRRKPGFPTAVAYLGARPSATKRPMIGGLPPSLLQLFRGCFGSTKIADFEHGTDNSGASLTTTDCLSSIQPLLSYFVLGLEFDIIAGRNLAGISRLDNRNYGRIRSAPGRRAFVLQMMCGFLPVKLGN